MDTTKSLPNTLSDGAELDPLPAPLRPNSIRPLLQFYAISSKRLAELSGATGAQIRRAANKGTGLGRVRWSRCAEVLGVASHELHNPDLLSDKKILARLKKFREEHFFGNSVPKT